MVGCEATINTQTINSITFAAFTISNLLYFNSTIASSIFSINSSNNLIMINKTQDFNIFIYISISGHQNTTTGTTAFGTGTWYNSSWHELFMQAETSGASNYVPKTIIDRRWILTDSDVYDIGVGLRTVSGNGYVCTGGRIGMIILNQVTNF